MARRGRPPKADPVDTTQVAPVEIEQEVQPVPVPVAIAEYSSALRTGLSLLRISCFVIFNLSGNKNGAGHLEKQAPPGTALVVEKSL